MTYTPECWKILKCTKDNEVVWYKVFGGWRGGFANGDSWKLNSGITEVKKDGDMILFSGYSGSVYECYPGNEGITGMWLENIKTQIMEAELPGDMKIVEIDFADFEKEFVS